MKSIGLYLGVLIIGWTNDGVGYCYGFQIISSQRPLRRSLPQKPIKEQTTLQRQQSVTNNNNFQSNKHSALPNSSSSSSLEQSPSSFRTALCIVPPDECWDTLQRARHFARDQTYHQWPPAIRLFYPFCERSQISNVAFDVARVVEKHKIEPFPITLNKWTVMPLPNNLQNMLEPGVVDEADDDSPSLKITAEEQEVLDLIAMEERKGLERKRQREWRLKVKARRKAIDQGLDTEMTNSTVVLLPPIPDEDVQQQQQQQENEQQQSPQEDEEFNGPAMIALEPDERSVRKLKKLRELLRHELHGDVDPTVSSVWESPDPDQGEETFMDDSTAFRPLIPMGAFPTIDSALSMARKLKGLWNPLTYSVTDLHFISQPPRRVEGLKAAETKAYQYNPENPVLGNISPKQGNVKAEAEAAFGCDALVMFMGEELEQDEEANDLMAQMVCKEGAPGGFEGRGSETLQYEEENAEPVAALAEDGSTGDAKDHKQQFEEFERKLNAAEGDWEDLLDWLDGEEEEDDETEIGTTVVIGRTHLFSGEARMYDCMPASSTADDELGSFGLSLGSDTML